MEPGNEQDQALAAQGLPAPEIALLQQAAQGAAGWTVRCTPRRRTLCLDLPDGRRWFVKLRRGGRARARAEWHWLHTLPLLGMCTPKPVAFTPIPGGSLLCTEAVAGRPADVLWQEAARQGTLPAMVAFALRTVAPLVRRLHDRGLVFRDLYWNHLLVAGEPADGRLFLIDLERVFAPRWRWRRWVVKDLAGLLASLPCPIRSADQLRFLRAYLGGELSGSWKDLAEATAAKARRIRRHQPRYG